MSYGRKVSLIFILLLSALLIISLIIKTNNSLDEWNKFKQSSINKYSCINDIHVYSITPPRINIQFFLNEKLSLEDVSLIFEDAKKSILSESVFKELQKLHKKKYKYSFGEINIIFTYKGNNKSEYAFSSAQDVNGEASYTSFNKWYIEYNNGPAKVYKPLSK